jgi:hypothetical protein
MNKQDLDALANLYEEVYYSQDVEQLDEGIVDSLGLPQSFPGSSSSMKAMRDRVRKEKEAQRTIDATNQRRDMGVVLRDGKYKTIYTKTPEALSLADRLNKEEGRNKPTPRPAAGSGSTPPPRPAGSGSTPPPRPAASSTVLAKQKGVEGKLDKATGKFTAGAFSGAEKSRYSSVAAQNAARSSASSGAATPAAAQPKPATPAVGKLGNTSFERRTPTSAELRAAQGERERQKTAGENTSTKQNSEKALQAAQKTNLPTTGPTPATPDMKSVSADLARANTPANLNRAPAGSAAAKALAAKPATSTPTPSQIAGASQGIKPATPGTNSINNTNPQKKEIVKSSYEWPSAKTIRDIAGAYASIYEAKKKDQDKDGDNDFADVRIARMIASGVPKEVAIAKVKGKPYNEEFELDEATAMAKRGHDETAIRNRIAKSTGGGEAADRATELENRPTYGRRGVNPTARQNLARAQRGDFRRTTSSDYGLRGYAHKSDDPAVKAKQAARGAQRGALTPREKKQLNREAYEAYEFVASYLLENNFASTVENANVIISNMSEGWFNQIMEG